MRYIVTTRKEITDKLWCEKYILIGVDGTVPSTKYDFLFDHHRANGADIQIQEIPETIHCSSNYAAIITTMVDADAICSAYVVKQRLLEAEISDADWELLEAISYDCDHLAVPQRLTKYADVAAMVVAALKQASNPLVDELGLPSDSRTWAIDQKEQFSSAAFAQGVDLIEKLLAGEWDYQSLAKPYMDNLVKTTEEIKNRVSLYRGCLLFDARGLGGKYIDPRCWLRAAEELGLPPALPVTLVTRDVVVKGEWKGLSHTIGCVPFHSDLPNLDFTKSVFTALTEAERKINPDCDAWGGRKTVGGSGWNTCSNLLPEQVIDIAIS